MTLIQVFDPPMCCSTGVCGPSVDPDLARFAADLDWLARKGVRVERFNLAQQPGSFLDNAAVRTALEEEGNDCLPVVVIDGRIVSQGFYPDRNTLAELVGAGENGHPSLLSAQVRELVAIAASIAANCEPCLKYHYDKARKLGVSAEDMNGAVAISLTVKEAPARAMVELADRLLVKKAVPAPVAAVGDCCAPSTAATGTGCCS